MKASNPEPGSQRRVGAYAKLLANYWLDDAIIEAGEQAEVLFTRSLSFCSTSDSDGYITERQIERSFGAGLPRLRQRIAALVRYGVWEQVDGGYNVRCWLKYHDSAEQKGRKKKADRDRKAKPKDADPPGVAKDSARNPDGRTPDSLSLIQSMTGHDSATTQQVDGSPGGERPEPLREAAATEPPPKWATPADARCTGHLGVADPGPCNGCRKAREIAERDLERDAEMRRREDQARALACNRCDGTNIVDAETKAPTRRKCDHRIPA